VSVDVDETGSWQRVSSGTDSTLVFSAHLDTRWTPAPLIHIIGISSERDPRAVLCRLWFDDSSRPVFSSATFQHVSESHDRRYVDHVTGWDIINQSIKVFLGWHKWHCQYKGHCGGTYRGVAVNGQDIEFYLSCRLEISSISQCNRLASVRPSVPSAYIVTVTHQLEWRSQNWEGQATSWSYGRNPWWG